MDPLDLPGTADLTADVDFSYLRSQVGGGTVLVIFSGSGATVLVVLFVLSCRFRQIARGTVQSHRDTSCTVVVLPQGASN